MVQYNLALIYEQVGEDNKAQICYEKVIEINSDIPDVHNNLGLLLQKKGKLCLLKRTLKVTRIRKSLDINS